MQNIDLGQTLYDMNKQLSATEEILTAPELVVKQDKLKEWFKEKIGQCGYAMLLNNELHYYTIFYIIEDTDATYNKAAAECIGCCTDRGDIISISERQEDGNYEIWVRIPKEDEEGTEDYMFMLFCCDDFVIEC